MKTALMVITRMGSAVSVTVPDAPTITSPTANQVLDDSTPDIVASSPSGATLWKFRIASDSGMTTIVASADDQASNTWTVSSPLTYADTLYVQTAAGNEAGYSDWSTAVAFKQSYRLKVLSYNPTEAWRLNDASGTTVAALVDSARNGSWSGSPALATQAFLDGSNVPVFDASNDYGNLLTASLQSAWSGTQGALLIWLYDTHATAGTFMFAASAGDTDAAQNTTIYNSTTHRSTITKTGQREGSAARVTSTWRCIGVSWNTSGNVYRMTIDGVNTSMAGTTLSGSGSLNHFYVGRRVDGRYWKGSLAWCVYWNTEQALATLQALSSVPT